MRMPLLHVFALQHLAALVLNFCKYADAAAGKYCTMFDNTTHFCAEACCHDAPGCCYCKTVAGTNEDCNNTVQTSSTSPDTTSTPQMVPTQRSEASTGGSDGAPVWAIIAAAVLSLIGLVIMCLVIILIVKKKNRHERLIRDSSSLDRTPRPVTARPGARDGPFSAPYNTVMPEFP